MTNPSASPAIIEAMADTTACAADGAAGGAGDNKLALTAAIQPQGSIEDTLQRWRALAASEDPKSFIVLQHEVTTHGDAPLRRDAAECTTKLELVALLNRVLEGALHGAKLRGVSPSVPGCIADPVTSDILSFPVTFRAVNRQDHGHMATVSLATRHLLSDKSVDPVSRLPVQCYFCNRPLEKATRYVTQLLGLQNPMPRVVLERHKDAFTCPRVRFFGDTKIPDTAFVDALGNLRHTGTGFRFVCNAEFVEGLQATHLPMEVLMSAVLVPVFGFKKNTFVAQALQPFLDSFPEEDMKQLELREGIEELRCIPTPAAIKVFKLPPAAFRNAAIVTPDDLKLHGEVPPGVRYPASDEALAALPLLRLNAEMAPGTVAFRCAEQNEAQRSGQTQTLSGLEASNLLRVVPRALGLNVLEALNEFHEAPHDADDEAKLPEETLLSFLFSSLLPVGFPVDMGSIPVSVTMQITHRFRSALGRSRTSCPTAQWLYRMPVGSYLSMMSTPPNKPFVLRRFPASGLIVPICSPDAEFPDCFIHSTTWVHTLMVFNPVTSFDRASVAKWGDAEWEAITNLCPILTRPALYKTHYPIPTDGCFPFVAASHARFEDFVTVARGRPQALFVPTLASTPSRQFGNAYVAFKHLNPDCRSSVWPELTQQVKRQFERFVNRFPLPAPVRTLSSLTTVAVERPVAPPQRRRRVVQSRSVFRAPRPIGQPPSDEAMSRFRARPARRLPRARTPPPPSQPPPQRRRLAAAVVDDTDDESKGTEEETETEETETEEKQRRLKLRRLNLTELKQRRLKLRRLKLRRLKQRRTEEAETEETETESEDEDIGDAETYEVRRRGRVFSTPKIINLPTPTAMRFNSHRFASSTALFYHLNPRLVDKRETWMHTPTFIRRLFADAALQTRTNN